MRVSIYIDAKINDSEYNGKLLHSEIIKAIKNVSKKTIIVESQIKNKYGELFGDSRNHHYYDHNQDGHYNENSK